MQHAGIDVAEHAVLQAVAVEQVAQFGDVLGQVLRRHRGVFDKRLRPRFASDVAEQADRALAHAVDLVHRRVPHRQRVAQTFDGLITAQVLDKRSDASLQLLRIVAAEFNQVDAQSRPLGAGREILGDAVPDNVLHRQQQHFRVHGFDRQRLERHQRPRIAQRVHESGVADVHQHRVLGNRQHIQPRLDDKTERTFGAAQHAVEVETAIRLTQVREVVTGQAAVEVGKALFDQFALLVNDLPRAAIDFTDPIITRALRLQFVFVQRLSVQTLAATQDHVEFQHMVASLAVGATALAAGIGVDHAADGGAVGRRQFRGEKQPGGFQRGVELVLDHPGLHPHPALLDIDFEDTVHVPRQVDDDAVRQRLAVGAGAAAAWRDHHVLMRRLGDQLRHSRDIVGIHGKHRRLRQALIDRVIGGQYHATGVIAADLTAKTAGPEGFEERLVIGGKGACGRQLGNHRSGYLGENRAVWR